MKKSYKWTLGTVASLAIGCGLLGTTLLTKPIEALAEDVGTPVSYINVGASEALAESEFYFENATLAVDESTAGTAGVNADGLGVFASYRTNASVSVEVEAGDYQVAALVDADGAISVNGEAASAEGKRIIYKTVTATDSVTVTTAEDVKLYAVMVAPANSKILMHSEWTESQVVVYGKLLEEELTRGCPAYYSDGSVENAIEYTSIPAGIGDGSTGVNENFNAVTATGTFKATGASVKRGLIVMPEKLVYFINAGSVTDHVGPFGDDSDPYYDYNKTVFDYYKSVGSTLKNDGIPDQESTGGSVLGHYENGWNGGDKSLNYPFNTGRVTRNTDFHTSHLGFRLPGVEAGSYKVYIGTVSYWHGRTLGVKINNQDMGNIYVPPARVVHTFDIEVATAGTVDIYLTGASTNEALASFVALQKAEDVPEEAPAAITSESKIVGLTETSVLLSGVQKNARVQIYSGARPYNLIYEEIATSENFTEDGYKLDYGKPISELTSATKIYAVQLTAGGYGSTYEFSITDIQGFKVEYTIDGKTYGQEEFEKNPVYTTGNIILQVSAHASSGLDYYKVRKDFDKYEEHDLGSEYEMSVEYEVTENGTYEFVIYSLLGVSYSEPVVISQIDRKAPTLSLSPVSSTGAWLGDKFPVMVSVTSVSDVENYEVIRGGEVKFSKNVSELEEGKTLKEFVLDLTEAGEYLVTVTNKAKQSATATVVVGNKPVYSTLQKMPRGSDVELTFGCIDGYSLSSLAVYRLLGSNATKLSVLGIDQIDIYNEGTYAAVINTREGTTEVYSFEIQAKDFKKANSTSSSTTKPGTASKPNAGNNESFTGTIVAACIFGVALIGLVVVLLLLRKKKPAVQTVQGNAEGSVEEEETVVAESAEETRTENEAVDSEEDDEV